MDVTGIPTVDGITAVASNLAAVGICPIAFAADVDLSVTDVHAAVAGVSAIAGFPTVVGIRYVPRFVSDVPDTVFINAFLLLLANLYKNVTKKYSCLLCQTR